VPFLLKLNINTQLRHLNTQDAPAVCRQRVAGTARRARRVFSRSARRGEHLLDCGRWFGDGFWFGRI